MDQPVLKSKERLFKHMKLMVLLCTLPLIALYSIPFIRPRNMGLVAIFLIICLVVHGGVVLLIERKSKE